MADEASLKQLVDRVFKARKEYYKLISAKVTQSLGPPATDAEIDALEDFLEISLPPSYKSFLRLHNGWTQWEGDIRMLSTDEMQAGEYAEWISEWKLQAKSMGESAVCDSCVIATELNSACGLLLNISSKDDEGEMEILNWDNGPISRYRNMTELLESDAEEWESLLNDERQGR